MSTSSRRHRVGHGRQGIPFSHRTHPSGSGGMSQDRRHSCLRWALRSQPGMAAVLGRPENDFSVPWRFPRAFWRRGALTAFFALRAQRLRESMSSIPIIPTSGGQGTGRPTHPHRLPVNQGKAILPVRRAERPRRTIKFYEKLLSDPLAGVSFLTERRVHHA